MRDHVRLLLLATVSVLASGVCADPLFKGDEAVPADAVTLFDGKDLSGWVSCGAETPAPWKVEKGYMETRGGNICTKRKFRDCQIHVEFWLPKMDEAKGQERANSGVYVQGLYEIQVLDSYGLVSGGGDCGAIYGVGAPMVNACRPPEKWQTYDIFFRAVQFNEKGEKTANARISVIQNGVWIHSNVEIPGPTAASLPLDPKEAGPLMLQYHGSPVRYRNVWVRPL